MSRIFVCYRNDDSQSMGQRVVEALMRWFSPQQVLPICSDTRKPPRYDDLNVEDAVVVVIGPQWSEPDTAGRSWLEQADDLTRSLIATAMGRKVLTIPVLVSGAALPEADQLPLSLRQLALQSAIPIRDSLQTDRDLGRVAQALRIRRGKKTPFPWGCAIFLVVMLLGIVGGSFAFLRSARGQEFQERVRDRLDPINRAQLYLSLGWEQLDQGDLMAAFENFAHAKTLDLDLVDAYLGMGTVYQRWVEYDSALYVFDQAIALEESDATYGARGWLYLAGNRRIEARDDFLKAISYNATSADAFIGLGWSHFYLRDYRAAVEDFRQAIDLAPNAADAYRGLGYTQDAQGKVQEALESYLRFLELKPGGDPEVAERILELQNGQIDAAQASAS